MVCHSPTANSSQLPLLLIAACLLTGLAAPVSAADSEYQLLVVACDRQDCKYVAAPRMAVRPGNSTAYSEHDMKVEIETLTAHQDEADANVRVEFARGGTADARRTLLMLPVRLTSQALTTLATFVSGGTVYQVWAKMLKQ